MKLLLMLLFTISFLKADYLGYISEPLKYREESENFFTIQNPGVIQFKEGLKVSQCIITDIQAENLVIICTGSNFKNIIFKLNGQIIEQNRVFSENSYIIANDIDHTKILKDLGGN